MRISKKLDVLLCHQGLEKNVLNRGGGQGIVSPAF